MTIIALSNLQTYRLQRSRFIDLPISTPLQGITVLQTFRALPPPNCCYSTAKPAKHTEGGTLYDRCHKTSSLSKTCLQITIVQHGGGAPTKTGCMQAITDWGHRHHCDTTTKSQRNSETQGQHSLSPSKLGTPCEQAHNISSFLIHSTKSQEKGFSRTGKTKPQVQTGSHHSPSKCPSLTIARKRVATRSGCCWARGLYRVANTTQPTETDTLSV